VVIAETIREHIANNKYQFQRKTMVLTNEVTLIVSQRENKTGVQDAYQNSPKFHTMGVH
jgi:hypothetical protein